MGVALDELQDLSMKTSHLLIKLGREGGEEGGGRREGGKEGGREMLRETLLQATLGDVNSNFLYVLAPEGPLLTCNEKTASMYKPIWLTEGQRAH